MCRLEGLVDGTLDLEIIAVANDYIDAQEENEQRAEDAYAEHNRR
jgi:hypothetical protein